MKKIILVLSISMFTTALFSKDQISESSAKEKRGVEIVGFILPKPWQEIDRKQTKVFIEAVYVQASTKGAPRIDYYQMRADLGGPMQVSLKGYAEQLKRTGCRVSDLEVFLKDEQGKNIVASNKTSFFSFCPASQTVRITIGVIADKQLYHVIHYESGIQNNEDATKQSLLNTISKNTVFCGASPEICINATKSKTNGWEKSVAQTAGVFLFPIY